MMKNQYGILSSTLLIIFLLLPLSATVAAEMTLAAADSTCATLKKAGEIFSRRQGGTIHYICKSSGMLAKGIESGYITADYAISASQKWMDYLIASGLTNQEAITPLWENRIIAVASTNSPINLQS